MRAEFQDHFKTKTWSWELEADYYY